MGLRKDQPSSPPRPIHHSRRTVEVKGRATWAGVCGDEVRNACKSGRRRPGDTPSAQASAISLESAERTGADVSVRGNERVLEVLAAVVLAVGRGLCRHGLDVALAEQDELVAADLD